MRRRLLPALMPPLPGERTLSHDPTGEQPFPRDLHGVTIPPGPRQVRVQAHDRLHGYGGRAMDVALPGR